MAERSCVDRTRPLTIRPKTASTQAETSNRPGNPRSRGAITTATAPAPIATQTGPKMRCREPITVSASRNMRMQSAVTRISQTTAVPTIPLLIVDAHDLFEETNIVAALARHCPVGRQILWEARAAVTDAGDRKSVV